MAIPFQLALGNNTPTTVVSGAGRIDMPDPTYLDIHGGLSGQVLITDGNAGLYWGTITPTGADAPSDSAAYGRFNGSWTRVVAADGGTMTGPLFLSGPPTAPLGAATKEYVDTHVNTGPIDAGTY